MFRIVFLYFALSHLPGCPNGPWSSKHLGSLPSDSLSFIFSVLDSDTLFTFSLEYLHQSSLGDSFFLFLEAFIWRITLSSTYRHISEGENMDSLCSGWKKKQAFHEYQWQFSNEKNLLDTLEMKLSDTSSPAFNNLLLLYLKKKKKKQNNWTFKKYTFSWLHWVLVAVRCGMWDLLLQWEGSSL